MDSPSRLVVVGLPTLILRCLSTTFKSGQRCNFRTVLIIPRITFSHCKQSMASQRPRRCLIFLYVRLILLISQLGFRASYRPAASYFSCRPIQKSPRFSWYRFISRVCSAFQYCIPVASNWPRTIEPEGYESRAINWEASSEVCPPNWQI